jgi:hypothetical protein
MTMRIPALIFLLLTGSAVILASGDSHAQSAPSQAQPTQAPWALSPDFKETIDKAQRGVNEMPPPDPPHRGSPSGGSVPPDLPHQVMPQGGSPNPDLPHAAPPR